MPVHLICRRLSRFFIILSGNTHSLPAFPVVMYQSCRIPICVPPRSLLAISLPLHGPEWRLVSAMIECIGQLFYAVVTIFLLGWFFSAAPWAQPGGNPFFGNKPAFMPMHFSPLGSFPVVALCRNKMVVAINSMCRRFAAPHADSGGLFLAVKLSPARLVFSGFPGIIPPRIFFPNFIKAIKAKFSSGCRSLFSAPVAQVHPVKPLVVGFWHNAFCTTFLRFSSSVWV